MKIRIKRANTAKAGMCHFEEVYLIIFNAGHYRRAKDYLEELHQQSKWDAEKCKSLP